MSDPAPVYPAGRETDEAIFRRVFEFEPPYDQYDQEEIPSYSTDFNEAWTLIVGLLIEGDGTEFLLEYTPRHPWPNENESAPPDEQWRAFTCHAGTDMGVREAYASTPELAICRLALSIEDQQQRNVTFAEKNAQYRDEHGVFHYRNGKLIDPKTNEIVIEATP